jgi:hypothetical protein
MGPLATNAARMKGIERIDCSLVPDNAQAIACPIADPRNKMGRSRGVRSRATQAGNMHRDYCRHALRSHSTGRDRTVRESCYS